MDRLTSSEKMTLRMPISSLFTFSELLVVDFSKRGGAAVKA
jgi:hypothetical protein